MIILTMKRFLLSLALVLCATGLFAQVENAQVNGSFQIDGQYYQVDEGIGITEESIKNGVGKFGINGFGACHLDGILYYDTSE